MSKRELLINVFVHEDLKDQLEDKLYLDHFFWIESRLGDISDRSVDVIFIAPSDAPLISTFSYKNEKEDDALDALDLLVSTFKRDMRKTKGIIYDDNIHKFLLLTRDNINDNCLGIAYLPGQLAIASTTRPATAAHEIGHMFNAIHEDADDTYEGLPNKSIMSPSSRLSHRFSKKNQENIRAYLNQFD
jgi:hypothetical protein